MSEHPLSTFEWQIAPPASHRMDAARLRSLSDALAARGTQSLLVIRNDRIVHEQYAPGHGPLRRHYSASLAKSLVGGMSLLLALNDGRIDVDHLASRYIPAWQDDLRSKITIRHLAAHASGIEDSVTPGTDHEDQPGWKGDFWRGRSNPRFNPIAIAIHRAPLAFEPGTGYAYSNPGMAALAYAVTASLRGAPQTDLDSLLRERIMNPIGIPEADWSISYGRAYELDGLRVYANWGGGSYTARAVARVGRLMLRCGNWEGQQLIDPAWVRTVLAHAGMPLPSREQDSSQPGSGLCWWTNSDGIWPALPRDAFAGAGAGHQVLLVVPSRDLIVVRNGAALETENERVGFWEALDKYLFAPLMDAFLDKLPDDALLAPYPPSPAIQRITFAPPSTIVRRAFHSDNWPITWADDDDLYTAYGDGRGFEPFADQTLSLGFARVAGPPATFQGVNIRSETGERQGHGATGAKASGMLTVHGTLYMWARNTGNAQLAWSQDRGQSWTWSDWKWTVSMGCPTFLNFGRDYAGARDNYLYIYSPDAASAYEPADRMVMARVPCEQVTQRSAYEFLVCLDDQGHPQWTSDIEKRGAVFEHARYCRRSGISYHPVLKRYLWWQQFAESGADTRFLGGFGIYDAPEPWGPWTTAYFTREWDTGPGETGSFPTKWMSADGKTCHLVFSGYDCFSVRQAILER